MRTFKGLWIFYRKLMYPSAALSICLGLLAMKGMAVVGASFFAYVFLAPMFHYFTYEVNNPNEYYFYYNLGLSKVNLWINTIAWSSIIGAYIGA
jgi:hypothetical protein